MTLLTRLDLDGARPRVRAAGVIEDAALVAAAEPEPEAAGTRARVLLLVAAGMPKRQVARELGVARARVREIVAAARGAPKRRSRRA